MQTVLNPFTIRIRPRNSREFLTLDRLPDGGSLRNILTAFLDSLSKHPYVNKDTKRALKVEWFDAPTSRTIEGQLKKGDYGYSAELENIGTGNTKRRTPDDCEFLPLYFRFDFRSRSSTGIAVLQRYGIHGAKSALLDALQDFINNNYSHAGRYTVDINPLITESEIREVLGGGIKEVRYIKAEVPDDLADAPLLDDEALQEGSFEVVVKTKRGALATLTDTMKQVASGTSDARSYFEIQETTYDDVKLKVDVNGTEKTVPLRDLEQRLRMNIDITKDVTYDDSGHPTLRSVQSSVRSRLTEFRKAVGWSNT